MSEETLIEWCNRTWSPWFGCRKVSPACAHCYITSTTPFRVRGIKHGDRRDEPSEAYWKLPERWNREAAKAGISPRVFPSLCDPFDEEVSQDRFDRFMRLVIHTTNLTWLLLTKRPDWIEKRMSTFARRDDLDWDGFPKHVMIGVTVENPDYYWRIDRIRKLQAGGLFVSAEPILADMPDMPLDGIDQVIFGGESDTREAKARPCHVQHIRTGIRRARQMCCKVFVKQLGSYVVDRNDAGFEGNPGEWPMDTHTKDLDPMIYQGAPVRVLLRHKKGGDPAEWPKDLRIREPLHTREVAA